MSTETTTPEAAETGDVLRRTSPRADELLPRPPVAFRDADGRGIEVRTASAPREGLVAMYADYDRRHRSQGLPPTTEPAVRDWLDRIFGSGHHCVARHEEAVVGHAGLVPVGEAANGDTYELCIYVAGDYHAAGIGSHLLRALLGLGRAKEVDRVWLTVARDNSPAVALYDAAGFEIVRRGPTLEMRRRL